MEPLKFNISKKRNLKDQEIEFPPKNSINLFPKNIRITAIIGENGSGKTSILEAFENIYLSDIHHQEIKRNFKRDEIIPIFFTNNRHSSLHSSSRNIIKLNQIENENEANNIVIATLAYSKELLNNDILKVLPNFIELKFLKEVKNELKNICNLNFSNNALIQDSTQNDIYKNFKLFLEKVITKTVEDYKTSRNITDYMIIRDFLYKISIAHDKDKNNKAIIIVENLIENSFSENYNFIKLLKEKIYTPNKEKNLQSVIEKINNLNLYTTINKNQINPNQILISLQKEEDTNTKIEDIKVIFKKIERNYFNFKFYKEEKEDKIYFSNLSSGEQQLLLIYGKINYLFFLNEDRNNNHNFVFLFDEPDICLHPNWQKKFINKLVNFLSNHKKLSNASFNIIITSHSPFILSDLPKENVIFLKNGKQEYPFKDKQTFGANIHTLLSDGFFMSDGLMGEFAKGKIEEIKKFYDFIKKFETRIISKVKTKERIKEYYLKRKERFEHIQSIIGEPFLQTIIKNYLDELYMIFSDDKTLINKELKELEARQKHLMSLKND
jgi:predicted ATP-dependent endonuclease of OLD family